MFDLYEYFTEDVQTRGLSWCEFLKRRRIDRSTGKNEFIDVL